MQAEQRDFAVLICLDSIFFDFLMLWFSKHGALIIPNIGL